MTGFTRAYIPDYVLSGRSGLLVAVGGLAVSLFVVFVSN